MLLKQKEVGGSIDIEQRFELRDREFLLFQFHLQCLARLRGAPLERAEQARSASPEAQQIEPAVH